MCKFIAERIITCQCTNENLGNSLTKRDFRLQSGNLVYKMRFSFTKRDSWVTNGTLALPTLALHFTRVTIIFVCLTTLFVIMYYILVIIDCQGELMGESIGELIGVN